MEIVPNVHAVAHKEKTYTYAYLVDAPDGLTLIDTLYDADGQRVLDAIDALGRQPTDLKHIILTHAHRAHLGGVARLKELTGATVYAHEWEAGIIEGSRRAPAASWRPYPALLSTYPYQVLHNLGVAKWTHCAVDQHLSDGDRIGPLHVLHTPGHAMGHLSFHWPERDFVVCGDAVVSWPAFVAGWPGFTMDARQQAASVRRMAELEPKVIAFGHGPPVLEAGAHQLWNLVRQL
jgi:glyoxylase-like metal-dependent hydrolase (beta-lactamase superfamily II)